MVTDEQLAHWRELSNEATEGRWDVCTGESLSCLLTTMKFIAASREAVPALLDEVKRLKGELATAKAKLEIQRVIRRALGVE